MIRTPNCVLLVSLGLMIGCADDTEQALGEFIAPDGDYQVRVTLAESWLPRAPHTVRLYLLPRGEAVATRVVAAALATSGTPFKAEQLAFKWVAQRTVMLCLKPQVGIAHGLRIELVDPPQVESFRELLMKLTHMRAVYGGE